MSQGKESPDSIHSPNCAGFCLKSLTRAGCVPVLILFAGWRAGAAEVPGVGAKPAEQTASIAQVMETGAGLPSHSSYINVTYENGLLRIDARDSTLSDILAKVAEVTGAKVDVPAEAKPGRIPIVLLGPGPARQTVASLLGDTDFDYLIQASDTDPDKVRNVVLMVRDKSSPPAAARSPYARATPPPAPVPEEPPAPAVGPAPDQAQNTAEVNALNSQAPPTPPDPSTQAPPAQPASLPLDPAGQFPLLQQDPANPTRPGALTPPQSLDQQSISSQLQQMYQQRVQLNQQGNQTPAPNVRQ
jgi:hypothetical protein